MVVKTYKEVTRAAVDKLIKDYKLDPDAVHVTAIPGGPLFSLELKTGSNEGYFVIVTGYDLELCCNVFVLRFMSKDNAIKAAGVLMSLLPDQ